MPTTAAFTNQLKQDLFNGVHVSTDVYKCALYTTAAATLNASTTAYTATGEITGTGYTATGTTLAGFTVGLSTNTAYLTFTNPSWTSSTITADTALIYNSSKSNKALCVLTFTSTSSSNGTWTLQLPAAGASSTMTIT